MQVQNPKQGYKIFKLNEYSNIVFSIIPNQWDIVTVGSMTEQITKGTTPTTEGYGYVNEGIPFFKVENIDDNGNLDLKNCDYISEYVHEQLLRSQLKEGDILFTLVGTTLGKVGVVKKRQAPSNVNQALGIIRIKDSKCDPSFLQYILRSSFLEKQINIEKTISVQPNISLTQLTNFRIPKPPLKEQHKIASILSRVDELIQKTDQVIEQIQRLKKGLMQTLLTTGIGHTKFKIAFLGDRFLKIRIPERWAIDPLSKIAKVIDVRHYTPHYTQEGFPLILPNNVKAEGLDLDNTKFTNEEDYRYMTGDGRNPVIDDIIYSRNASFGIACRVDTNKKFSLGQDLVLIKPEKINSYLLFLIMNSRFVLLQLARLTTGSTFKRINLALIKNFSIPYPDEPNEENKISEIIQNVSNQISSYQKYIEQIQVLKKGLMQKLLTGKIRVKV